MRGVEQIPWAYDLYMSLIERGGFGRWRSWVARGARGRTLEVGCGTGRNLPIYEGAGTTIGMEIEPRLLARARRRAPEVPLVVGRAEALPFADGRFDTVVSSLVFCSVDDPQDGLAEVRRVLRAGGQLRMLEHVRSRVRPVAAIQDLVQPIWTWCTGGCRPNRDTEAAVRVAGFVVAAESHRARGTMRRFFARLPSEE